MQQGHDRARHGHQPRSHRQQPGQGRLVSQRPIHGRLHVHAEPRAADRVGRAEAQRRVRHVQQALRAIVGAPRRLAIHAQLHSHAVPPAVRLVTKGVAHEGGDVPAADQHAVQSWLGGVRAVAVQQHRQEDQQGVIVGACGSWHKRCGSARCPCTGRHHGCLQQVCRLLAADAARRRVLLALWQRWWVEELQGRATACVRTPAPVGRCGSEWCVHSRRQAWAALQQPLRCHTEMLRPLPNDPQLLLCLTAPHRRNVITQQVHDPVLLAGSVTHGAEHVAREIPELALRTRPLLVHHPQVEQHRQCCAKHQDYAWRQE